MDSLIFLQLDAEDSLIQCDRQSLCLTYDSSVGRGPLCVKITGFCFTETKNYEEHAYE